MRRSLLFYFIVLSCYYISGQISTTVNPTISQIQAMLQGSGISITSMSLTCPSGAYASFNNGLSALGGNLNSGILLTTGTASNIAGPPTGFNSLNNTSSGGAGSLLGNTLSGGTTYDGCYIDFTLIPSCSTLSLKYVFASEEYPEFTTGTINDVFGFVLSGQNPGGGNYNQTNIAILPVTTTSNNVVSIQNVNNGTSNTGPCMNCSYYIADPPGLVYDGCTTALTASASVVPCQQYTLTVGIWDDSDGVYDSGVFLDFNGVACNNAPVINVVASTYTLCSPQTVTLTANGGYTSSTYTWTSSTFGNLASTSGATVYANPTSSSSYTLSYEDSTTCVGLPIHNYINVDFITPSLSVNSSLSNPLCAGQSTSITATAGTGNYTWTPSTYLNVNNVASVVSTPTASVVYTVNFQDMAGCIATTTVDVQVSLCTGINSITENDRIISVFPNPVNSKLYFKSDLIISQVKVFNQNGQQLALPIESNYINCSQLYNGLYIIEFKTENSTFYKRFVKMD